MRLRRKPAAATGRSATGPGGLAVLLAIVLCTCISLVEASRHSHSRVHLPRDFEYTFLRRSDHPSLAERTSRRSTPPSLGTSFGSSAAGSSSYAKKHSSPPAPYEVVRPTTGDNDGGIEALWDDTVLLQFNVPSPDTLEDGRLDRDSQLDDRISILLHPVDHFLHPDARITYTAVDPLTGSQTSFTERISRDSVLVYAGTVLYDHEVPVRWAEARVGLKPVGDRQGQEGRGWARISLSKDERGRTVAQGAFSVHGELHHLQSMSAYESSRRTTVSHYPVLTPRHYELDEGVILLRDRDLVPDRSGSRPHLPRKTGPFAQGADDDAHDDGLGCAHDSLSFNTDPSHPIYSSARQAAFNAMYGRKPSWVDALLGLSPDATSSFTDAVLTHRSLLRRQSDVAGGNNISSNYINSIGSTNGCFKSNKVLYMGLAADCTYVAHYGGNQSLVRITMLTNLNSASEIYQRTFNVSLGVVELNVPSSDCPTTANSSLPWNVGCPEGGPSGLDLNSRLSAFSSWRGAKSGSDGAGLWHLMTNCSTGSEVGVAWLGTLCAVDASGSAGDSTSGTAVTAVTPTQWQVMAHEIGHNFGAIHDCVDGCTLNGPCCPLTTSTCNANNRFIMNPVSESNLTMFSSCSTGNICSAIGSTLNTSCLYTPGDRTVISLQECGNGILEPGEECDPGTSTNTTCCTSNCKLQSGAVCDPTTFECCTSSCQFASNSTVCRPAVSSTCDVAEYCTGSSETCPPDMTKPDGMSCGSNGLACASGYCTSKDLQCQTLGTSLNLTQACPNTGDTSCTVTCADPTSSASCIVLTGQNFVDGTSCGYGGHCELGQCQSGSWQNAVSSWYTDNLRIAIPITIVGAIVVLLLLWTLARFLVRYRRGRLERNKAISAKFHQAPVPANFVGSPPSLMTRRSNMPDGASSSTPLAQQQQLVPQYPDRGSWQSPPVYAAYPSQEQYR